MRVAKTNALPNKRKAGIELPGENTNQTHQAAGR